MFLNRFEENSGLIFPSSLAMCDGDDGVVDDEGGEGDAGGVGGGGGGNGTFSFDVDADDETFLLVSISILLFLFILSVGSYKT